MKNKLKIYLTYFLIIIILTPVVNAQTRNRSYKADYEKAIKLLEFTKDVYISYPNNNARSLISNAEKILRESRSNAVSGKINAAYRQLRQIKNLLTKALEIILNNPLRRQYEKLEELLLKADAIVLNTKNRNAQQLLKKAKQHKTTALNAYKIKNYQLALEHYRLATFMANKAIDLAKNQSTDIQEKIREEREQVFQLLKRTKEIIDENKNSTALNFYRLAEKQLQKIDNISQEQNYSLEREKYQKATRLLLRAIDIIENQNKQSDAHVYNEVAALDELIESTQSNIESLNFQNNKRLMFISNQIITLQNDAHSALDNKNFKAAQIHTQMARKLVERALQILNNKSDNQATDRLRDEMGQLELTLNDINTKVAESDNNEAKALIELANKAKNNAQRFLERGNNQLTIGAISVANKFAFAAERLILANNAIQINEVNLKNRIQKNQEIIAKLNSENLSLSNRDKMLLREAEKRILVTNDNFNKGFLVVTSECLDIVEKILNRIEYK